MKISALNMSYAVKNATFKGIEKKDDPQMANIAIIGGGGRIGKNAFRQYLLAKHGSKNVYNSWDALRPVYRNQNIVAINMGSMELKGEETIDNIPDHCCWLKSNMTVSWVIYPTISNCL